MLSDKYKYLIWAEVIIICFLGIGIFTANMTRNRIYENRIHRIENSMENCMDAVRTYETNHNIESFMMVFRELSEAQWTMKIWPFEWEFDYETDRSTDEYYYSLKDISAETFKAMSFELLAVQDVDNERVENQTVEIEKFQTEINGFIEVTENARRTVQRFPVFEFIRGKTTEYNQ